MSSSSTKRNADAPPADEPDSRKSPPRLVDDDDPWTKWYHKNKDACTVEVRVGAKWRLYLTRVGLVETNSDYLIAAMDDDNVIDLTTTNLFPTFPSLVELFDDIVPYPNRPRFFGTEHGMRALADHIKRLSYIGAHTKMNARIRELESDARFHPMPLADLIEWASGFKSSELWTVVGRKIVDEGLEIPVVSADVCRALCDYARTNKEYADLYKAKFNLVHNKCKTFINSYLGDDDQERCNPDACTEECSSDDRCQAHPAVDYDDTDADDYNESAMVTMLQICRDVDVID